MNHVNYILGDSKSPQQQVEMHLEKDGFGDVNILINGETVAFFNKLGELWLVNFERGEIEHLIAVGIKFEKAESRTRDLLRLQVV